MRYGIIYSEIRETPKTLRISKHYAKMPKKDAIYVEVASGGKRWRVLGFATRRAAQGTRMIEVVVLIPSTVKTSEEEKFSYLINNFGFTSFYNCFKSEPDYQKLLARMYGDPRLAWIRDKMH